MSFDLHALAAELANGAYLDSLIRDHRRTVDGFCLACTQGGYGTPHVRWPCAIAALADRAARVRATTIHAHDLTRRTAA